MVQVRAFVQIILICTLGSYAQAQPTEQGNPTTLQQVVASTVSNFPRILAAREDIRGKQAYALAAEGVFDPRIEGSAGWNNGYYQGQSGDAGFMQTLPYMNTRVFGGYRLSGGDYPEYQGNLLTRDLGEIRLGFSVSLLRDRDIDERRAGVTSSQLDVVVGQQQLALEQIRVLQDAFVTYSQWLLAWRLHDAYEDLLEVGITRGEALQSSVSAGDVAEILLVENQQAVLQRSALVTDAQRQIDMVAEQLSLYFRDQEGNRLYPQYSPALELPEENPEDFSTPVPVLVESVVERRPEIAQVKIAQQQAGLKLKLAENLQKPKLDLSIYNARDFGSGNPNLAGNDTVADVSFSYPLRTREARGKAIAAQAEIDSLEYQKQLLSEQVEVGIRRAMVNLDATRQLEEYAIEELAMSTRLAEAEDQRFNAGLSDFFLLNVRERQMAEAQLKRWQAHLAHQIALAEYYGTSLNLEALGWQQ